MSGNRRYGVVGTVNGRSRQYIPPVTRDVQWTPPPGTWWSGDTVPWRMLNVQAKGGTRDCYTVPNDSVLWAGDDEAKSVSFTVVAPALRDMVQSRRSAAVIVRRRTRAVLWYLKPVWQVGEIIAPGLLNLDVSAGEATFVPLAPDKLKLAEVADAVTVTIEAERDDWYARATVSGTIKVVANIRTYTQDYARSDMASGATWNGPKTGDGDDLLEAYDDDESGMKERVTALMGTVSAMTGEELVAHMDTAVGDVGTVKQHQDGTYPNVIWFLENGLQIRYKPLGDGINSNGPMFCIEGQTNPSGFSRRSADVTFKVMPDGEAANPGIPLLPQWVLDSPDSVKTDYIAAACATTHLICVPKAPQAVTWDPLPALVAGMAMTTADLSAVTEGGGVPTYKAGVATWRLGTVATAGTVQVKVSAPATRRYLAGEATFDVTIHPAKATKK